MLAFGVIAVIVGVVGAIVLVASMLMAVVGFWAALAGGSVDRCAQCGHYFVHYGGMAHECRTPTARPPFLHRHHLHLPHLHHQW